MIKTDSKSKLFNCRYYKWQTPTGELIWCENKVLGKNGICKDCRESLQNQMEIQAKLILDKATQ